MNRGDAFGAKAAPGDRQPGDTRPADEAAAKGAAGSESNGNTAGAVSLEERAFDGSAAALPVPEPGALFLVGTGLVGIALTARRRRRVR